jgi:bacterioferritin
MDKAQIIELLRADMRGEHQAIIQYLNHAYARDGTGVAPAIEAIAREEMRHLDWLADAITGLGGDPDMGRERPDLAGAAAPEQMEKNVALEQQAIDQYRRHLEVIDDAEIRRTLARIVHDEEVHRGAFEGLAEKLAAAAAEAPAEAVPEAGERLAEMLNYGVQHEYTCSICSTPLSPRVARSARNCRWPPSTRCSTWAGSRRACRRKAPSPPTSTMTCS